MKGDQGTFANHLYMSGTTFFTLGYGDLVPTTTLGRAISVAEAGIGFTFLAIIVSYLPILYQAFSRREVPISLLDARAGSPPTAGELLRRMAEGGGLGNIAPDAARVGTLGRRALGESSLVSCLELLPLATRQSIVGRLTDDHARYVRAS